MRACARARARTAARIMHAREDAIAPTDSFTYLARSSWINAPLQPQSCIALPVHCCCASDLLRTNRHHIALAHNVRRLSRGFHRVHRDVDNTRRHSGCLRDRRASLSFEDGFGRSKGRQISVGLQKLPHINSERRRKNHVKTG